MKRKQGWERGYNPAWSNEECLVDVALHISELRLVRWLYPGLTYFARKVKDERVSADKAERE